MGAQTAYGQLNRVTTATQSAPQTRAIFIGSIPSQTTARSRPAVASAGHYEIASAAYQAHLWQICLPSRSVAKTDHRDAARHDHQNCLRLQSWPIVMTKIDIEVLARGKLARSRERECQNKNSRPAARALSLRSLLYLTRNLFYRLSLAYYRKSNPAILFKVVSSFLEPKRNLHRPCLDKKNYTLCRFVRSGRICLFFLQHGMHTIRS